MYEDMKGEPVIFQWADYLRSSCIQDLGIEGIWVRLWRFNVFEDLLSPQPDEENKSGEEKEESDDEAYFTEQEIPIMSGTPLTDRKSKFFDFFVSLL